jgi:hypothetical protein
MTNMSGQILSRGKSRRSQCDRLCAHFKRANGAYNYLKG